MIRFLLRRTAQGIAVLWAAYTVGFLVLYALPGDPVQIMLNPGGGTYVPEATLAAARAAHGFDQPLIVQYFQRVAGALTGDLGMSVQQRRPVSEVLADALPDTLVLAGAALVLSVLFGVGLAAAAAFTRSAWLRNALLSIPAIGISIPLFWSGIVLIQLVSFRWNLLPAVDDGSVASIVLPAVTLAIPSSALIAQVFAQSLIDTSRQPFTTTAAATGASRARVFTRQVLRPSLGPVLALLGVISGSLLAGAVVVETVFSRTGIGRVTANAVTRHDIPVVLGVVGLAALVFVLVTIIVDALQLLIDPRIRRAVETRA